MSVSASITMTGVGMSVRTKLGFGIGVVDVELIAEAPAERLWIRYASYAWSRGLMALTYVVIRDAGCDSPSAIRYRGVKPASGFTPRGATRARAAWEYMSYEKSSPGWLSVPYRAGSMFFS